MICGDARLVALSGPRGCGKSTAAARLAERWGFTRLSFADPVREEALRLYPAWSAAQFAPGIKERICPIYAISPRAVLREIGEARRAVDRDFYVREMRGRVAGILDRWNGLACIVIDDLRLPLEAHWVRGFGGVVVHVRRSGMDWSGEHATEVGPGAAVGDMTLPNPGSLDTLRVMVDALAGRVLG